MYKESLLYTAKKDGIKEGMERGIEKGMEKGVEKEKIKIAINSLENGLDIKTISLITGLTIDEINSLSLMSKNI
ncbi:FIG00499822: hypothetical protein [hydrothermal vent metagenome]|uniref:Transposase n=1 Tax=hydrothermal vent metagenome TaxID=652676 RepID=A0A1W1BLN4_9ZZZZ